MMTKTDIQTVLDALHIVDSCVGLKNYFHDKPDGTERRLDRVVDDAIAILQAALAEPSEQPVAWKHRSNKSHFIESPPPPAIENLFIPLYSREKQPHARDAITWTPETGYVFAHPATKPEPLTLGTIQKLWSAAGHKETLKGRVNAFARAVEAAVWGKMNGK